MKIQKISVKHLPFRLVVLATVCIMVALLYSFHTGLSMVRRYAPLQDAAMEVKLEAAFAHLWFEEIISGDRYIDIQVVWEHIDQAEWYARAMLEGGKNKEGTFIPLELPVLRQKIEKTLEGIDAFRTIAKERWNKQSYSGIGSEIDQEFDKVFKVFLIAADEVETALQKTMEKQLLQFRQAQWALIVSVGMCGILVGWLLQRYEKRRMGDIRELQESREQLIQTQRIALLGSWSMDLVQNRMWWSEVVYEIFEADPHCVKSSYETFLELVHPNDRDFVKHSFEESVAGHSSYEISYRLQLKCGRVKYVTGRCETLYDNAGKALQSVGSVQDITEQQQTEEALRRTQKMDAIGQLTGGIAHDFNNLLGVILGNTELLKLEVCGNEKIEQRAEAIGKSAQRAADLTRQLLGFSSYRSAEISVININTAIYQMTDLISRSVTPQVEVNYHLTEELWSAEIDPGEFQDALLNLVINARDAMDGLGHLTVETGNHIHDDAYCSLNPGVRPGRFVKLSVSDTGKGIPQDQQARIFEPFFTTKEQGKGTGLGLSMVYGFVNRSKGHIKVYSESGVGTTFNIYLPCSEQQAEATNDSQLSLLPHGSETILAVDDEAGLLEVAKDSLEALGYRVLTAADGHEALQVLSEVAGVDLLFSDVVMPGGISGYDLADKATTERPGLKVLLTSGYTEKAIAHNGQSRFDANLLSKPYSQVDLAGRVWQTLNEPDCTS